MNLPVALFGYVAGPLRWEGQNSFELYEARKIRWVWNRKPTTTGQGPLCVTHLQKESTFGFLLMRPFCLHVWIMPKPQTRNAQGAYIPGSEDGIYGRTPGKRFDFADWKYINTGGRLGRHWD